MKRLEADCLHRDQLHPAIRDRLARIRELPHSRVAILRGVERFGSDAYMVWNFVAGAIWNASEPSADVETQTPVLRSSEEPGSLTPVAALRGALETGVGSVAIDAWTARARELMLAVDALHAQGIVHGSLHGGNVIISTAGEVWLTDLSPYLYDDPAVDTEAIVVLLRQSIAGRENLANARQLIEQFDPRSDSLRELANSMLIEADVSARERPDDRQVRWRSLIGAMLLVIGSAAIALLIRSRYHQ